MIALDWYGRAKTWVVTSYEDVQKEFAGSLKTVNPDALDSAEGVILSDDQRTHFIVGREGWDFKASTESGRSA